MRTKTTTKEEEEEEEEEVTMKKKEKTKERNWFCCFRRPCHQNYYPLPSPPLP